MRKKGMLIGLLLALALVGVMAAPVMGQDSDTQVIGVVAGYVDVTAPGDIDLGTMDIGENPGSSTGSVASNTDWEVTASDQKDVNAGYMTTATGQRLTNKFQISPDGRTFSDADTDITYTGSGNASIALYVNQVVDAADPPGTYSITITFVGSIYPGE